MTFKDNCADPSLGRLPMNQSTLRLLVGLLFLILCCSDVRAKEWRGIVPLKSIRAEVERLFGKPNKLGRYEIENERVSIWYSEAPCEAEYQAIPRVDCECLVPMNTVLRVWISLDSGIKASKLGIDKKKYQKTPFPAYHPTSTYSDFDEGVVYTIRESDDTVINIEYLPSAKDCEEIVRNQAPVKAANVWRGIVPFYSTRADVDRLLGSPKHSYGDTYIYRTTEDRIDVTFSDDVCKPRENPRRGLGDIVLKIAVSPSKRILIQSLTLDKNKYRRVPNHHPENWVHYINSEEGITVDAILNEGCEQVMSIIYQATARELELRCGHKVEKKDALVQR